MKIFATKTEARKIQMKYEIHTMELKSMSINDHTHNIKSICESLASTNVVLDDDDKIEVCVCGLRPQYKCFATSI